MAKQAAQVRRETARGKIGAAGKTHQWAESAGGAHTNEIEPGDRGFEGIRERGCLFGGQKPAPQCWVEKLQEFHVDLVAGGCYYMVGYGSLISVLTVGQLQGDVVLLHSGNGDLDSETQRYLSFDAIADKR